MINNSEWKQVEYKKSTVNPPLFFSCLQCFGVSTNLKLNAKNNDN